jgi:hypothetical protein
LKKGGVLNGFSLDAGLLIRNLSALLVAIIQSTSCGHVSERSQHRRWAVVGSRSASGGLFFSLDCQLVHLSVKFVCNALMGLRLAHRVVRLDAVEPAVVRVDPAPRRAGVAPHEREVAGL